MYQRFTLPLASFVFALLDAPLGLQRQRSSSTIGFGISIFIIFIFYGVLPFAGALRKSGALPPVLAALMPATLGIITDFLLKCCVSKYPRIPRLTRIRRSRLIIALTIVVFRKGGLDGSRCEKLHNYCPLRWSNSLHGR